MSNYPLISAKEFIEKLKKPKEPLKDLTVEEDVRIFDITFEHTVLLRNIIFLGALDIADNVVFKNALTIESVTIYNYFMLHARIEGEDLDITESHFMGDVHFEKLNIEKNRYIDLAKSKFDRPIICGSNEILAKMIMYSRMGILWTPFSDT